MKPTIKLSQYYKRYPDFYQAQKFVCRTLCNDNRPGAVGFGPTMRAAYLEWENQAARVASQAAN